MAKRPIIPPRDPRLIEEDIKRDPDSDRIATTTIPNLTYRGVVMTSRYAKDFEYEAMVSMVEELPSDLVSLIEDMFCDSKACASYAINLRSCTRQQADAIFSHLKEACLTKNEGYNDIVVKSTWGERYAGADWRNLGLGR